MQTRPERTAFNETSTYADVVAFMEAAAKAAPKLIHLTSFGTSSEGRTLPLAVVGAPGASPDAVRRTGKLRVYIQGNIHAGEVEGKESAQMLLRELAEGKHADWLRSMVLLVAPIYNADGNEKFSLTNRGRQHGPMAGQGQRPNAQGYDLNRDHMKLDSPEARGFVKLMNDYDPHVSMDLHTTNGTRHAYHLTYAPPLNPATDPAIIDLLRKDWLPSVTRTIKTKYDWDYYYYGNVEGRGPAGSPDERAWKSFDSRPRFNNNYIGLRNRIAILSEAYLVRHLRGPHQSDEPVRRRAPRVRTRARVEDPDAHGSGRQQEAARKPAGAAGRARARTRAGRDSHGRSRSGEEPQRWTPDGSPRGREEAGADARVRDLQSDRHASGCRRSTTCRRR